MKRVFSVLMVWILLLSMQTPAFAEEPSIDKIVTVDSYEALQEALVFADDGDTIAIAQTIRPGAEKLETEKEITIARAEGFDGQPLIIPQDGTVIKGFKFFDTDTNSETIAIYSCSEIGVKIQDCYFNGGKINTDSNSSCFIDILGSVGVDEKPNKVEVQGCTFLDGGNSAIIIKKNTDVTISDCVFRGNQGRAITSTGKLVITDSLITENSTNAGGGGISSGGDLTLSRCKVFGNTALAADSGADILAYGKITITDAPQDGEGYFDVATGEKIDLPIFNYEDIVRLTYMTDSAAEEYFAPPEVTPPLPDDNDDNDYGENDDLQQPQIPGKDADDSDNDDNSPVYYPPNRTATDTNGSEQEQPQKLILACGNVRIDIDRTAILTGYGDGQLHAEDSLTRAQLAVIIYRSLDEKSRNTEVDIKSFRDVPTNSWCALPVSTLYIAGAVNGIGNGLYSPNTLVTWEQVLTVLSRFVEPQKYELKNIHYAGWALSAVETAVYFEWIDDNENFVPEATISRGEFVELLNDIFEKCR